MRKKLHLMAINAEGENIEQAFLVIHPFNEDLLNLIYDRHCAKQEEECMRLSLCSERAVAFI